MRSTSKAVILRITGRVVCRWSAGMPVHRRLFHRVNIRLSGEFITVVIFPGRSFWKRTDS